MWRTSVESQKPMPAEALAARANALASAFMSSMRHCLLRALRYRSRTIGVAKPIRKPSSNVMISHLRYRARVSPP